MTAQGFQPPGPGGHSASPNTLPAQQNYLGCTNEIENFVRVKLLMLQSAKFQPKCNKSEEPLFFLSL